VVVIVTVYAEALMLELTTPPEDCDMQVSKQLLAARLLVEENTG